MLPGFITMCQKVTGYLLQMCSPLWIPLIHVAQMAFAYLLKACLVFTQSVVFKNINLEIC